MPTWSNFRAKALEASNLYNVNWLKSEYHQTIATANMARKWQEFQETKELYPNLKYVTVGDNRVRDKHKKWDGFIAPIDHPIWKKLLPPNDWGCRCDIIPTDEKPTKGYETFTAAVKNPFNNNAAISGKVFLNSAYELTLNATFRKEAKFNVAQYLANSKEIVKSKHKKLTIAIGADNNDLKRNYDVAAALVNDLDIEILIRKHNLKSGVKNPEYLINSSYLGDRKSIEKIGGITTGIDAAKKQMMHPSVNPNKIPYYIVWDLDKLDPFDIDKIIQQLVRKVTKNRGTKIKAMLFYYKGKSVQLTRTKILNRNFKELESLK